MPREYRLYLDDILEAIRKIGEYTRGMSYEDFLREELVQDGVVRNLEVIGAAVKSLPQDVRDMAPHVEWRKIAGLRDVLSHAYFAVDFEVLWDIVIHRLPALQSDVLGILSQIKGS